MKNFIILTLLAFAASIAVPSIIETNKANAQLVTLFKPAPAKDTLSNTDNTSFAIQADNISRSLELYALRRSGNIGTSYMILQGQINEEWYNLDTLTCTDKAVNSKVVNLRPYGGSLLYKNYRVSCVSAGTVSWEPRAYLFRRSN